MNTTYEFVQGDTGSKLEVTCKDNADDSAIDLTGATVRLKWIKKSDATTQSKTMTITSATTGVAEYQFAAGELVAGNMNFDVEITDSSSKVTTSLNPISVQVRGDIS